MGSAIRFRLGWFDTSPSCLKLDLCLLILKGSTRTSTSTESIILPLFSVDLCRNWLSLFMILYDWDHSGGSIETNCRLCQRHFLSISSYSLI